MSGRLAGQVAWISGGASGIGAATVRLFAAEGASVAIIDTQKDLGHKLEGSLRRSDGVAVFMASGTSSRRTEKVESARRPRAAFPTTDTTGS